MRIETLEERIANAKAKIERKQNAIAKKESLIEKKQNASAKTNDENDILWLAIEIANLKEDIVRNKKEIIEAQKSLAKYEAQLAGEIEKESVLKDVPECVKRMQTELVKEWDAYDIARRERIKEARKVLGYEKWCRKYSVQERYVFIYKTDEQIHRENEQDAKILVLNLINRVKAITGEITDWDGIHATVGTHFGAVLNGYVVGKEGRAMVESIYAGGWNIQRLHVRVLVHEC